MTTRNSAAPCFIILVTIDFKLALIDFADDDVTVQGLTGHARRWPAEQPDQPGPRTSFSIPDADDDFEPGAQAHQQQHRLVLGAGCGLLNRTDCTRRQLSTTAANRPAMCADMSAWPVVRNVINPRRDA